MIRSLTIACSLLATTGLCQESKPAVEPSPRDKRFQDPEWDENRFFAFIKQAQQPCSPCHNNRRVSVCLCLGSHS